LRGHNLKVKVQRSRLQLRQGFFSQRVVCIWNSLPSLARLPVGSLYHALENTRSHPLSHSIALARTRSHSLSLVCPPVGSHSLELAYFLSNSLELARPVLQNHSVFTRLLHAILQMLRSKVAQSLVSSYSTSTAYYWRAVTTPICATYCTRCYVFRKKTSVVENPKNKINMNSKHCYFLQT